MKKLERSRSERVLFGVCGGVARYLGVDADLVRVLWLVSVAAGGLGWVLYIAAYFLVPEATGEPESGEDDALAPQRLPPLEGQLQLLPALTGVPRARGRPAPARPHAGVTGVRLQDL